MYSQKRITSKKACKTVNNTVYVFRTKRNVYKLFSGYYCENKVVKMVNVSSIKADRSVLRDNYRYLSHKYSINFNEWRGSYNAINGYMKQFSINLQYGVQTIFIIVFSTK